MSDSVVDKPLKGKYALVTGGAKRIGRETALALARAGANVAITYLQSEEEAGETCSALFGLGVRAMAVLCDVRGEWSVGEAMAAVLDQFGGLDVLVNSAGTFETAALETVTLEQWNSTFEVNTRGPFVVAKAAHAALKASGGRIINVGSLGGTHAWATHGPYCASKAALHMLSQTMAKAWAPEISVNTVAPGMIAMDGADAVFEALARKTPMQRNGTAADVAAAILFFASAPKFITGQLLAVDGGLGL